MEFDPKNGKQGRPAFAKEYGVNEDQSNLIPWDWVDDQMEKSRNYWITSVKSAGGPHAAPVWGVYVKHILYFGSNKGAQKTKNLLQNPHISVHLESGDEVVIIEGRAEVISDQKAMEPIASAFKEKYPPFNPEPHFDDSMVLFAVLPQKVFAWTEKDFVQNATCWVFD